MGDMLLVKKKDFVYFMAEVINCTFQAKGRSEKIEIIVKSAARYLNIQGISGRGVQEELKKQEQVSKESWSQD